MKQPMDKRPPLSRNFDEDMNWPDTQITLKPHGVNGLSILEQKKPFPHPFHDVASAWVEFFTEPGTP